MSEETNKKKQSRMQRVITGTVLAAGLIVVLALGKWVTALAIVAALCLAVYEEFGAFKAGGYRPVMWPSYAALAVSVPLMLMHSAVSVAPVMMVFSIAILFCVMRREKPELLDALVSATPLITLVLPGMCAIGLLDSEPRSLQLYLLLMMFAVPILGDTFAYVVGSNVGGPKLCPLISPNKTISGAIGGLLGSVLGAVVVGRLFHAFVPAVTFPPMWAELLVGLVGGAAAQMGDLFASMIKRHCKIKDFGHLFPGHGGMLDRLDSIIFTAIIIYCFRAFLL